jgi:hypothetical protein
LELCILLKVMFSYVVKKILRDFLSVVVPVTPCSLVDSCQYLGGMCSYHLYPAALKKETARSSIMLLTKLTNSMELSTTRVATRYFPSILEQYAAPMFKAEPRKWMLCVPLNCL